MNQNILELPVMNVADMLSHGKPVNLSARRWDEPERIMMTPPPIPVNSAMPVLAPTETVTMDTARRLALLYELPIQLETETQLDTMLQTLLEQLIEAIPGAVRGALLLHDRESDELLLKAYVSSNGPAVNKHDLEGY
jgi:hypothetical protein